MKLYYQPLHCSVALDDDLTARGSLFYDDGESLDTFEAGQYYLASLVMEAGVLVLVVEQE